MLDDVARCAGTDHALCQVCRRRERRRSESNDYWGRNMEPAIGPHGCPDFIAPAESAEPKQELRRVG
jgi:hypothetical protein